MQINTKNLKQTKQTKNVPKKSRVFGLRKIKPFAPPATQAGSRTGSRGGRVGEDEERPTLLQLVSQRRHAVEVKAGPPRAALVLVHFRAVAVLVRALRRLVRIIVAYLLVLLLLFDADQVVRGRGKKNRMSG